MGRTFPNVLDGFANARSSKNRTLNVYPEFFQGDLQYIHGLTDNEKSIMLCMQTKCKCEGSENTFVEEISVERESRIVIGCA